MTDIVSNRNSKFSVILIPQYLFVMLTEILILALQLDCIAENSTGIRIIQFVLQFLFILFFSLIILYHDKKTSFILILCFQVFCSISLWGFYYYIAHEPLGYDPNDALVYQKALESSFGKGYSELIKALKAEPRTSSLSDWGYPTYRFLIYKIVPDLEDGLLATVIINAIIHAISSLYVFKISKRFISYDLSIIVMALWGLSATSVHVNTCGLKETIFSFFTVMAVYNLIEIEYGNKVKRTFLFIVNIILIWFFRNYISIFLFLIYLGCYPFRKIFYKFYPVFFIGIFLTAFLGMDILTKVLPELRFVKTMRDRRMTESFGSTGLIPNCMNFFFAWITPIPKVNSTAQIKQILFSGFSIYKAFFSLFGIYSVILIIRNHIEKYYPLITFMACNIVLVIITCNSLDFRFLHPSVYIDMILIVLGFEEIQNSGLKIFLLNKKLKGTVIIILIFLFIYVLMLFYNR